MSTLTATAAPATIDPRLAAFLSPNAPEIFHSIATHTTIWEPDPYDVDSIHQEARDVFARLLNRATQEKRPANGAIFVVLGEAGSGKTHLMRALRNFTHEHQRGYCGYMQMTTEASNYARYVLINVIDSLEHPYHSRTPERTGLRRLSLSILEQVPDLQPGEMEAFREGEIDTHQAVETYADRLHCLERFQGCDIELLRIMLYLQRNDVRVRSRAMMWLRCQEMRTIDRQWIGEAVPRTDDADPMRMLVQLGKLIDTVHQVPLVLLIDQLEDIANQSASKERFIKLVDTVTALTDACPNTVIVLAALEDYYRFNRQLLIKSKVDRLEASPLPLKLLTNRGMNDIEEMVRLRLEHLYANFDVAMDLTDELYPFTRDTLNKFDGLRARDVLQSLRDHHQRCILAGKWLPFGITPPPPPPPPPTKDWNQLWNEHASNFKGHIPIEDEDVAELLKNTIQLISHEMPTGYHFGASNHQLFIEVETHHPNNTVVKRLLAICNASPRGGGLNNQLGAVEKRAGDIPISILRMSDFPASGEAVKRIGKMLKRDGVRVTISDSDLRRMVAFNAFFEQHQADPSLRIWMQNDKPLHDAKSLLEMLRIKELLVAIPRIVAEAVAPPLPPNPVVGNDRPVVDKPDNISGDIIIGQSTKSTPQPVIMQRAELTQHMAFLGGTGSGKTTAALNIIEQLLLQGVPAILIDRKGDLCRYASPSAWDEPLSDPTRAAERQQLREQVDVALYTPGNPNGRALAIPIVPAGYTELDTVDRDQFALYAASALGGMIGFRNGDVDQAQLAILAKAIFTLASNPTAKVDIPSLEAMIRNQDEDLLNAIGGGYSDRYFEKLAERLQTLRLNNQTLFTAGEVLDIKELLGTASQRPRLSIISTRFLDAQRLDFWMSQFLISLTKWCARSPRKELQAVIMFDEADIYLPAVRRPATKGPMEDLLRRGRSAGLGIFLATQSPGDFDYRCRENIRSWLIGKVKEDRALEKLRPMLEAGSSNAISRLSGLSQGEFFLVREANVNGVRSNASLMRTDQLPESAILELARTQPSQPIPSSG